MVSTTNKVRLVAVPFAGGITWRFEDQDGKEVIFDNSLLQDIEFDLSNANRISTVGMIAGARKYFVDVRLTLPFEWS